MEYLNVYRITSAGTMTIPCPSEIAGVYSDGTFTLDWDYNGRVGPIVANVTSWEPTTHFKPNSTSFLKVTVTAPCNISVRVVDE